MPFGRTSTRRPWLPRSWRGGLPLGLDPLEPRALPADLVGAGFTAAVPAADWGDAVPLSVAVRNAGRTAAGASAVDIRLSADARIDAADPVVGRVSVPALAAGSTFRGSVTVTLPAAADLPPELAAAQTVFLGTAIDPDGAVAETDEGNNLGSRAGIDLSRIVIAPAVPEDDVPLSNASFPLVVDGTYDPAAFADEFRFTPPDSGRLRVGVLAAPGVTVSLVAEAGTLTGAVVVRADAGPDRAASIDQHIDPGTYRLVFGGAVATAYRLSATFDPASPPLDPVFPKSLLQAVADFDGDNVIDVAAVQVTQQEFAGFQTSLVVRSGGGDGSFRTVAETNLPPSFPREVVAADFDRDGHLDLVLLDFNTVSVLLGRGDGSFSDPVVTDVPFFRESLTVTDIDGDGLPDLVIPDNEFGSLMILCGNGDGTFTDVGEALLVGPEADRLSVTAADLNGDGVEDLAVIAFADNTLNVVFGRPDRAFEVGPVTTDAFGLTSLTDIVFRAAVVVSADFNHDGRTDLVAGHIGGVVLMPGNGDGTFQPRTRLLAPLSEVFFPALGVADVNGDGTPDLVTKDLGAATLTTLLGNGGGTFRVIEQSASGGFDDFMFADVSGDGRQDLVTFTSAGEVKVLVGNGDGSFQVDSRLPANGMVVSGDVNGDGKADLITNDAPQGQLGVLVGNGDGSFQEFANIPDVGFLFDLHTADLNRDGRLDLITVGNPLGIGVLLGNGDGSFQPPTYYTPDPAEPFALVVRVVVSDLNGDGATDLVAVGGISRAGSDPFNPARAGRASVLLGNPDGTFRPAGAFELGVELRDAAAGDLNGDGRLDLTLVDSERGLFVVLGTGDGTFGAATLVRPGAAASVTISDLNRDGRPDLVTQDASGFDVTTGQTLGGAAVLLGNGDGTFRDGVTYTVGDGPPSIADVNGDGILDLVVQTERGFGADGRLVQDFVTPGGVEIVLGFGDGDFDTANIIRVVLGVGTRSVVAADFDRDGNLDLAGANSGSQDIGIALGSGSSLFLPFSPAQAVDDRATPVLADFDRDGTPDIAVRDSGGNILFRRGVRGTANRFDPPVVVNPGRPAREIALVRTPAGPALAATNEGAGGVTVYAFAGDTFAPAAAFNAGIGTVRLAVGDLNGDGLDDVAVGNTFGDAVTVAFQRPDGGFDAPPPRSFVPGLVGVTPSDIALADLDGRDGLDVVFTDRVTGAVTVYFNDPDHTFTTIDRFRAGLGVSGLSFASTPVPVSREQPSAVAIADFNRDGRPDALVVDRGAHQLRVLAGSAAGGFLNPSETLSTPLTLNGVVADRPGQVVAADFDRDGNPDAAVVMEDRNEVWVFRGAGDGTFTLMAVVPAGNGPTGLSVQDVNGDGTLDLMVGNGFGDVLFVLGNGDGTFRPFVRADLRVPFAVTDLNADGVMDVVLADQSRDTAAGLVRAGGTGTFFAGAFRADGTGGLIGPGDVQAADVNGDGRDDLVFANTGSNNVLVYLRRADGSFGNTPLSFFAGTGPAAVRVTQLNDDNGDGAITAADLPDLVVANAGSNDVSVLFGNRDRDVDGDGAVGDADLFRVGPRLQAGNGPTAVMVQEVTGDGIPDILATGGGTGTLTTIPGIGANGTGTGFFNDAARQTLPLAPGPVLSPVADPGGGGGLFVAPRGPGPVVRVDPATGVRQTLFAPAVAPVALDATRFGTGAAVVTGNADGTVSVFAAGPGGAFAELARLDTGLGAISDVRAVPAGGGFDIYVTGTDLNGLPVALALPTRFDPDDITPVTPPGGPDEPIVLNPTIDSGLAPDGRNGFDLVATLTTGIPVPGGPAADGGSGAPGTGGGVEAANPLAVSAAGASELGLTGEELVAFVDGGLAAAGFFFDDEDESEADAAGSGGGLVPFLLGVPRSLREAANPDTPPPAAPTPGAGAVPPADPAPQANLPAPRPAAEAAGPAADPSAAAPSAVVAAGPASGPAADADAPVALAPAEPPPPTALAETAGSEAPAPGSAAEWAAADFGEEWLDWARVVGGVAVGLARRGRAEAAAVRRPSPLRPVDGCRA